ncbi:sialidase family protein [Chitinophaga flava]|uniref:exo-alpha-sialidase n=1 Tax=Chitinophaga flava TaxID=2259036 RepID=A0A365Y6G0_9BACT|nr:sialidase family protein [Chitinophaga flava]RBL94070.1 exo-alpha-sialidase [Chitinophaga flava]
MMNKLKLLTGLLLCTNLLFAQMKAVPVFTSGTEGYKSFRIPAIIRLPNGPLLAFAEGRVNNSGDFGDINIVMKRSNDNGATWGPLQTVVDNDSLQAGNPAPVVDVTDMSYLQGRIFLFYNTGNNHEGEIRKGKGLREVWYKTSADGGVTWSEPVNITTQVHRPLQPQINPAYNFKEDWRSYANTPGHATQFRNGQYHGRIYVAANHSEGNPQPHFKDYFAHGYYTDDHGKTFHLAATMPMPGGNEATAAVLDNGRLMLNARNQQGNVKARMVATSKDGGATWDQYAFDPQLPDPVCEGSLLEIGFKKKRTVLAFCNAADTLQRNHLTLRISNDGGRSWPKSYLIAASDNNKRDYAAYSDIVRIDKQRIGVLFERNDYREIVFTVVKC